MNRKSVKRILITGAALASMPLLSCLTASANQTNNTNQSQQPYNVLNRTVNTSSEQSGSQQMNDAAQQSPAQNQPVHPIVAFGNIKTYPLYQFNLDNLNSLKKTVNEPAESAANNVSKPAPEQVQGKEAVKQPEQIAQPKQATKPTIQKPHKAHRIHLDNAVSVQPVHKAKTVFADAQEIAELETPASQLNKPAQKAPATKPVKAPVQQTKPSQQPKAVSNNPVSKPSKPQATVKVQAKLGSEDGTQTKHFSSMFSIAKSKLGDPYVWGGIGNNSFDCSGFTQYVYGHGAHTVLPRTAQAQYDYTKRVDESHAKPGDLVFFGYGSRDIEHVGMYLGHGKMIDAQLRGVIIEHIHRPWWNLVGFGHYEFK